MKKLNKLNKVLVSATLIVAFFVPITVKAEIIPNGVDVSNNNTIADYQNIADSGIKYAYIKATEGTTFRDWKIDENYNGFKSVSIKTGFYCFMSEWTDASDQAEFFYNTIKDYNYELKPCLDIETNMKNLSAYELSNRVLEFCQRFKELSGQECLVYTGGYYGRDNLDNRVKSVYYGWIAHYGVTTPMETGFTVAGHQFSESYYIEGIGKCDVNNFNFLIGLNGSGENNVEIDTSTQITYNYNNCDMIQREKQYVGSRCLELQQLLNKVMGVNLVEDGIYGTNTHNELIKFQNKYLGYADGLCGQQTFAKLYELLNAKSNISTNLRDFQSAYNSTYNTNIYVDGLNGDQTKGAVSKTLIKLGSRNSLVGWIQCRIGASIDNNFGNETKQKLIEWQISHGLVSDGVAGQKTIQKLLQEYYW